MFKSFLTFYVLFFIIIISNGQQEYKTEITTTVSQVFLGETLDNLFRKVGNKAYHFGQSKLSWYKAYLVCRSLGSYLVSVDTKQDLKDLSNHLTETYGLQRLWWLSGSDQDSEDDFFWYSTGRRFGYADWAEGQPDNDKDRSGLLQAAAVAHHQQQPLSHLQPPSPPMPALDLYSAYAYQHQLQQQLLNSAVPHHMPAANPMPQPPAAEVLDLSRRDAVEAQRKTPSPYHTNSSYSSGSPAVSPNSFMAQQQHNAASLLYAAQAKAQQQAQNVNNMNIPTNLAALYPGLYYPAAVKKEPIATTPPPSVPMSQPAPALANNNILQTFAAAAAGTSLKHDIPEPHSPQQVQQSTAVTTPTSSTSNLAAHDPKNTRPFKAFPRDPLVIAANFAATDVLLDNPRVERYTEYRKRVLEQIRTSNGGSRCVNNPKMRRTNSASGSIHEGSSSNNSENDERHHEESSDCDSNSGHDSQLAGNSNSQDNANALSASGGVVKDAAYYERRRKNNAAAKKSRDRRRIKEDEIAIRAAYLERQNIELLCQIDSLKSQLTALTSKMS